MKVNSLKRHDSNFPLLLRDIPSPPKILYWAGAAPEDWVEKPKVAIVGSRKVTAYGRGVTEKLAYGLARAGVVIISGLAFGVDAIAHRGALQAGGITVAILPTNLAHIYPASNQNLARQILETGGTLISEYAPGSAAYKQNFIARNRIVSGLADVLIITEAAVNSGSLHTAGFALEQGKTVMAVPGNINSPTSEGTNNLIKSGALPVTDVSDIFFALGLKEQGVGSQIFRGSPEAARLLAEIKGGTSSQESLSAALGFDAAELNRLLTQLELSGHIKPAGGGHWLAV